MIDESKLEMNELHIIDRLRRDGWSEERVERIYNVILRAKEEGMEEI